MHILTPGHFLSYWGVVAPVFRLEVRCRGFVRDGAILCVCQWSPQNGNHPHFKSTALAKMYVLRQTSKVCLLLLQKAKGSKSAGVNEAWLCPWHKAVICDREAGCLIRPWQLWGRAFAPPLFKNVLLTLNGWFIMWMLVVHLCSIKNSFCDSHTNISVQGTIYHLNVPAEKYSLPVSPDAPGHLSELL